MPAITSLDQITGAVAQIKWLDPNNQSNQQNPLYILFLGDGFADSDEQRFIAFLKDLQTEFFRIPPFAYCRPYISFLYCFLPSKTTGLSGDPDEPDGSFRRVLRMYIQMGQLRAIDDQHPLKVVYRLRLPHDCIPPSWLEPNSASIWFDHRSKSYGAITVVANTNPIDFPDVLSARNFSPIIPQEVSGLAGERAQWFAVGMNGYDVQTGSFYGRYPNLFAHELCHSFNLYDEYEETGSAYNAPPNAGPIVEYRMSISNNVQRIDQIDQATVLDILKWKKVLTAEERTRIRTGDLIYTKEDLVRLGVVPSLDGADRSIHLVDPNSQKPLHWSQAYLIEGAKYRKKVYRPHFECKMRFDTYDERVTNDPETFTHEKDGRITYGSPEFCRVCNYLIRHHITGYTEFGIGGVNRNLFQMLIDNEIMLRLKKSFEIQNRELGTNYAVDGPFCEHASIRAYIVFKELPNPLDVKFNITGFHVALNYSGIIFDPTFHDLYTVSTEPPNPQRNDPEAESHIKYLTTEGNIVPFLNRETQAGFVSSLDELKAYLFTKRVRPGSYGSAGVNWIYEGGYSPEEIYKLNWENVENIVDIYFGEELFVGPDHSDFRTDTTYAFTLKQIWNKWEIYKKLKSENEPIPKELLHMKPLDCEYSVQTIFDL